MAAAQDLTLEEGESYTLSPDSRRLKGVFKQVNPRAAAEVRSVLGLTEDAQKAVQANGGGCCKGPQAPAATASAEDLSADDPQVRADARRLTYQAFNAYVYGGSPSRVAHLEPVFDQYLAINKAILNIATLNDIEVFDGATLTIAPSVHAVYANKVIIHRTGRIVCLGAKTWRIASLEGRRLQVLNPKALDVNVVGRVAKR